MIPGTSFNTERHEQFCQEGIVNFIVDDEAGIDRHRSASIRDSQCPGMPPKPALSFKNNNVMSSLQ